MAALCAGRSLGLLAPCEGATEVRKAKAAGVFAPAGRGSAFLWRCFYRQEDSERKKNEEEMKQMKRNGCQARRCFVCVHKEQRRGPLQ